MLVNLTPHDIDLVRDDGTLIVTIKPEPEAARCFEECQHCINFSHGSHVIKGYVKSCNKINGLPEPAEDLVYIVSAITALRAWAAGRTDVVCPGAPCRTSKGIVVGAEGLCVNPSLARQ